jgi:hypothetical protein
VPQGIGGFFGWHLADIRQLVWANHLYLAIKNFRENAKKGLVKQSVLC